MSTITKEQIIEKINELPPEMLGDVLLFIEFLLFKAQLPASTMPQPTTDPEGMFPALDLSYDEVESLLNQG